MRMASLVLSAAALAGSVSVAAAEVAKVGELEPIRLATARPYALDASREWVVSHPGATYIRLHFSAFDLAPGDRVILSNLQGTERYVYQGSGPHGDGAFWANSIVGDAAVVRLEVEVGGGGGFEVDGFGRGTAPVLGRDPVIQDPMQPESVWG